MQSDEDDEDDDEDYDPDKERTKINAVSPSWDETDYAKIRAEGLWGPKPNEDQQKKKQEGLQTKAPTMKRNDKLPKTKTKKKIRRGTKTKRRRRPKTKRRRRT